MLDYIYAVEEQRFFTKREHHLELLGLSKTLLVEGIRKHLALSGFRHMGKTIILKEFLHRHLLEETDGQVAVAYLDLPRLAFAPEAFATHYIGSVLYWLLERGEHKTEPYFDPAFQLVAVGRWGNRPPSERLYTFNQESQKEKPNQHLLLEMALNWGRPGRRN